MNIEGVTLSWFELFNLFDVFKGFIDVSFLEAAPGHVLIDLKVALITCDSGFVFSHGLIEILLFFIEETNFDQSVSFSLKSKSIGKDRILEIADGLLDLVGLSKDHSELVKDLTLLVEVR